MPSFDPYYKWLGIPPGEQPPNHYRLLGVPLWEADPEVIEAAAERQTVFLRTLQLGPQSQLSEKLLNEVARARVALLNAQQKVAYDQRLRKSVGFSESVVPEPPADVLSEEVDRLRETLKERDRELQERDRRLDQQRAELAHQQQRLELETMAQRAAPEEPAKSGPVRSQPRKKQQKKKIIVPGGIWLVGAVVVLIVLIVAGVWVRSSVRSSATQQAAFAKFEAEKSAVADEREAERVAAEKIAAEKAAADKREAELAAAEKLAAEKAASEKREAERIATAKREAERIAAAKRKPDVAAIKKLMTTKQLALGGPVVNSVDIVMVPIPPGEFTMGSPESEEGRRDGETQHLVKITKPFYLSAHEVTQDQYQRVMGKNPSSSEDPTKPVELVTWHDAVAFCGKLSDEEGVEYRLPTEAEWEYACRAGTTTAYSFGDDARQLPQYAWYKDNSSGSTHPVGGLKPNAWGLFDMHGNVWEWCQDRYGPYESLRVVSDPAGAASGNIRVLRGGAFVDQPEVVRAACRNNLPPSGLRYHAIGFRLARTYPLSPITGATVEKPKPPAEPPKMSRAQRALAAPIKRLMTREQKNLGGPVVNSVDIVMVPIPPGEFTMGSPESEEGRRDGETQHLVKITKPFYLSAHEVTQDQYQRVMGKNPSSSEDPTKPVELVTWHDAVAFCGKLSDEEGVEYRLPTEAEWEYACRAGTTTAYSFGDDARQLPQYAWYKDNSSGSTHPVGGLKPNAWGLFDMHGNVWEWCQDRYGPYESLRVVSDPAGAASGNIRVLRGGAFVDQPEVVRAACRNNLPPSGLRYHAIGFRLARTISGGRDKVNNDSASTVGKPEAPSPTPPKDLPAKLNRGLVAYYPFNGNAKDESGNGNHGEVHGAVLAADRNGAMDKAYYFAQGSKIEAPNPKDLTHINTVACWVNVDIAKEYSYVIIFGGHNIEIVTGNHVRTIGRGVLDSKKAVQTHEWAHIARTSTDSQITLFINGDVDSFIESGSLSSGTVNIGGGDKQSGFRGVLDDVRIYNRALSDAEVKSLYDFERTPPAKITKRKTRTRRKSTTPPLAVAPFDEKQAKAHQKAWARHLGTRVEISNSIGMQLKLMPPGQFMMGSPESEANHRDDETQHLVKITKPFYLSAHEVTQVQYERVMGKSPSRSKGATKPVEQVSWNDAVAFCGKLSDEEGVEYRLPTEAEWEYACRVGTTTAYSFGDDASELGEYAWHNGNSNNTTHPVGELKPNAWGLFDMHGNVWEWCQDWHGPYESLRVVSDPTGPASGSRRVLRGGAFGIVSPLFVRAADRSTYLPDVRDHLIGFRLARTYPLSP